MKSPVLIINTKAYAEGTGKRAERLAMACGKLAGSSRAKIMLAVQPSDILRTSRHVTTFAQHIDDVQPGSHTGHVLAESVKAAGARGTIINHSERRLTLQEIKKRIERAKSLNLVTVVCVPRTSMVSNVAALGPDYVAIEPPELIGTGNSVSKAKPGIIREAVRLARETDKKVKVLCGAGIATEEDVSTAMELGAKGVLLASGVVKARSQGQALKKVMRGF